MVAGQLRDDTVSTSRIVLNMLYEHFPPSIQADILEAVQVMLPLAAVGLVRRVSSNLVKVYKAYEKECADCGFDVRLRNQPVALESAQFQWQQAGGPSTEMNGLALCVIHQKLFDHGAFALSKKLFVAVSDEANGFAGFQEWMIRYHGRQLSFRRGSPTSRMRRTLPGMSGRFFEGNFEKSNRHKRKSVLFSTPNGFNIECRSDQL